MKRFIVLLSILITSTALAQHRPLKNIEVSDFPTNRVSIENKNNFTNTTNTYSASSLLVRLKVSHEKGIKYPALEDDFWSLSVKLDEAEQRKLKTMTSMNAGFGDLLIGSDPLILYIGESRYTIRSWYLGDAFLMIDISKALTEHISISGFQSIYIGNSTFIDFCDTEQELWRRCAKEVYDNRKHL